jgi:hypothetical protein
MRHVPPQLLLLVLLASRCLAQYQLCANGQSAPYCLCGAERQANDMVLDLTIRTTPPDDNINMVLGMTFDRAIQQSTQTNVFLTPFVDGVALPTIALFGACGGALRPVPPYQAGFNSASINIGCTRCGFKCTSGDEFFWQIRFVDQDNTELLCVRTQVWNQGVHALNGTAAWP